MEFIYSTIIIGGKMKDYFDISVRFNNELPEMKISLKTEFKKQNPALRENGKPYSGVELKYYLHHLENFDLAQKVWEFRKSLCSKKNQFDFLYLHGFIDENSLNQAKEWLISIDAKQKLNHQKKMSDPEVRKKISISSQKNGQAASQRLKKMWETRREELYEALYNPKTSESRLKNFQKHLADDENRKKFQEAMQNPERKRKISKAAKEMWKNADSKKIEKMRSRWNKKFFYQGKKMNSLELKIAMALDAHGVRWEYEPVIRINESFIQPDFVINNAIVIECFGDFWHANPNLYQDEEILFSTRTAGNQRDIDNKRIEILKSLYSDVIIIWESEIKSGLLESKIKEIIDGMD
jgi:G:T-mismatch repair DNA endonuclease (very short patch repair protein)